MAVNGIFASDSGIQGDRTGDFASGLLQTEQVGDAPLFALTAGMESMDATDTVVTWFEENPMTGRVQANGAPGTGAVITLDDASEIVAGAVMMVEASGEYVFVQSVSGPALTVTRGFAGTSIVSIADNEFLQKLGNANEEGSAKPTAVMNLGFPRFNYMQIFRNPWDVTGTAKAVNHQTGDQVAKSKREAGTIHAADIERSILFSKMAIGTMNGKPFRTMDGITSQLSSNVQAQGANTTWDILDLFLENVFSRNIKGKPNERIVFCGNTVVRVLNKIARLDSVMDLTPSEDKFGIKVKTWITPFGDIKLVTHPLFNQSPLWTKDMLVLHPGAVKLRYLRRTHEDTNDKDGTRAGADADFGVLTTEMCVEYAAELTAGYFTGIDTPAAS